MNTIIRFFRFLARLAGAIKEKTGRPRRKENRILIIEDYENYLI